jgi:tRNA A-37 threonylcarbamoyl transferase component Bud32
MHERGVFHRDLKGNNVLARGGEFWIVDVDRVDFLREVPWDARALNLAQLNASVGAPATRSDRLRFWFAYAGWNRGLRLDWKARVREVMRLTVARRHVWP